MMLACIHHVMWLRPVEGGKWLCNNCKEEVVKKDLYPKFDDLGPDFARRWERHEKGEPPEPMPNLPDTTGGGLTLA